MKSRDARTIRCMRASISEMTAGRNSSNMRPSGDEVLHLKRRARDHSCNDRRPAVVLRHGGADNGADRGHFVIIEASASAFAVERIRQELLGEVGIVGV